MESKPLRSVQYPSMLSWSNHFHFFQNDSHVVFFFFFFPSNFITSTRSPHSQWRIHGKWEMLSSTNKSKLTSVQLRHTLSVLPHCCVGHVSASDTNQPDTQALSPLVSCILKDCVLPSLFFLASSLFKCLSELWGISIQLCHEIWNLNE